MFKEHVAVTCISVDLRVLATSYKTWGFSERVRQIDLQVSSNYAQVHMRLHTGTVDLDL